MNSHEHFMNRCLDLARKGFGRVQPNPMVGAVVVHEGQIIGEGFHPEAGKAHAEVYAVNSVENKELLSKSTLYVSLEPCNHHGKTPPCTDLILQCGIPRVVVAQSDPNPLVAGSGIRRLREAKVEVVTGVLEAEARSLNCRFNTFHEHKRPYIILKWAQTSDGFIDRLRSGGANEPAVWITDEVCRRLVHKWRTEEAGILIGAKTAILDNPQLNVRVWKGRDPIRIAVGKSLRPYAEKLMTGVTSETDLPFHLTDQSQPTLLFTSAPNFETHNLQVIATDFDQALWPQVFKALYDRGIQSVIVEGGTQTLESLIAEKLWDEARIFTGPLKFGSGIPAPLLDLAPTEVLSVGNSTLTHLHSPPSPYSP